ncbi:MAG: sulfatase [Planctomycetaceae bacterium]|nr:sulfatase [Planctomycetaceae bacterium]
MRSFALTILLMLATAVQAAEQKLNVVFILADDLGWSDTTLFGTTQFYKTPHIERLAQRGMLFPNAYSSSPLCSPTRASILTGLSPARHGITAPVCHTPLVLLEPSVKESAHPSLKQIGTESVTRLKTSYQTLPKTLKDAGYATAHFGKWHLGPEPYSPLQHGFDVDIPHHPGPGPAGSYVAPWKFKDFDHDPEIPNEHLEDRMAKEAVSWMEQHRDEPFFLNYWMFSVHAPFDAKQDLIDSYRREVDPDDEQRSPTYAAMIESMDDAVGTLLDALDRLELADRTVIVFASDNGGNMYNEIDGTTPTSNRPLRGGKATMFEGGIRGPGVIVWPGVVPAASGSATRIQSVDFYPTLLDVLGLEPEPGQTFDGISLLPILKGQPFDRGPIFTYFPHNPAVPDWLPPAVSVHRGDWKLIRVFHGGKLKNGQPTHDYKLFNLHDDIGEADNLAAQHPELVQELDALIDQHLKETGAVVPVPNPKFDPQLFQPEKIGVPADRSKRGKRQTFPAVAGWTPRNCRLKREQGQLVITSLGSDPYLSRSLPQPLPAGDYVVAVRMSCSTQGRGQFFWEERGVKPQFFRERSKTFSLNHNEKLHDYQVHFTTSKPVLSIRLDPGQSAGVVRLDSLLIKNKAGDIVFEASFDAPTKRD